MRSSFVSTSTPRTPSHARLRKSATPAAPIAHILITGGAGFIGGHVVIHLAKKYPQYKVVNMDCLDYCSSLHSVRQEVSGLSNYKFVKGSITEADLVAYVLQEEQIDTILHFAAQSHVDNSFGNSLEFTRTNILGTHVLLEASKNAGISRFIHVSTDEVYGEGEADCSDMAETAVLEPTNPYAATKAGAEFLVKAYNRSFDLPTIITRSNNVYGPHQYPEKLIPKCISLLLKGKQLFIHGDGSNSRRYLFVSDVVEAFDLILHRGSIGQVYNIGTTHEVSNLEVAETIIRLMGFSEQRDKLIRFVEDRPFNDLRYAIDCEKLSSLGWSEKVPWEEGLTRTIQWYREHLDETFPNSDAALVPHPKAPLKGQGS